MKNNNLQELKNLTLVDKQLTVNESSTSPKTLTRTYRKMFTQLSVADYYLIERIAYQKNSTPYKIASAVLTLWLHDELVRPAKDEVVESA